MPSPRLKGIAMRTVKLGVTGLEVPALGLGCMGLSPPPDLV
jgi:aryl-alcohol dehydrogenase-like predicted oxidoreductase